MTDVHCERRPVLVRRHVEFYAADLLAAAGDLCGDSIQHVAVKAPNEMIYDIRGRFRRKNFLTSDWFDRPSARWVGELTQEAFYAILRNDVGGIDEKSLLLADAIVSAVFPEIPTSGKA
jgi:hypothetical protein